MELTLKRTFKVTWEEKDLLPFQQMNANRQEKILSKFIKLSSF